jgi:hypothetical protein
VEPSKNEDKAVTDDVKDDTDVLSNTQGDNNVPTDAVTHDDDDDDDDDVLSKSQT